jgi:Fe2+ or Zn2+ uptake regulation protein
VKSPSELAEAFRAQGLKVTPQRQLLFTLLEHDATHPTAEGLYLRASAQMPGISLRTVYQTLNDLVAMGELRVLHFTAGSNRFDPNLDHHHHAQCIACGELRDIHVPQAHEMEVVGLHDFHPHHTNIVVNGLCTPCAALTDPIQ